MYIANKIIIESIKKSTNIQTMVEQEETWNKEQEFKISTNMFGKLNKFTDILLKNPDNIFSNAHLIFKKDNPYWISTFFNGKTIGIVTGEYESPIDSDYDILVPRLYIKVIDKLFSIWTPMRMYFNKDSKYLRIETDSLSVGTLIPDLTYSSILDDIKFKKNTQWEKTNRDTIIASLDDDELLQNIVGSLSNNVYTSQNVTINDTIITTTLYSSDDRSEMVFNIK